MRAFVNENRLLTCTALSSYSTEPAAGLNSPFTENCKALHLEAGGQIKTLRADSQNQVFFYLPNPGATQITAECLHQGEVVFPLVAGVL